MMHPLRLDRHLTLTCGLPNVGRAPTYAVEWDGISIGGFTGEAREVQRERYLRQKAREVVALKLVNIIHSAWHG
jgi:hypothetical protein